MATNYQLPTSNWRQWRQGFGLIEFLIVIAIFGLSVSLITASFLTFERNQRVKNAARQLKSDLRLAQNKASSGDKSTGVGFCTSSDILAGWYVTLTQGSSSYTIAGDCLRGGSSEETFGPKVVNLPRGVTIKSLTNGIDRPAVNTLFQPLTNKTTFHAGTPTTPPFYLNYPQGTYRFQLDQSADLVIILTGQQASSDYKVIITPSGEINETK